MFKTKKIKTNRSRKQLKKIKQQIEIEKEELIFIK